MRIVLTGRTTIPVHCPGLSPLFLTLTKRPGVWGYSSHFGTRQSAALMRTRRITQVLSFHILAHSFALFCILKEPNSLLFNRFRTLCPKTPGCGGILPIRELPRQPPSLFSLSTFNLQLSTFPSPYLPFLSADPRGHPPDPRAGSASEPNPESRPPPAGSRRSPVRRARDLSCPAGSGSS